MRYVVDWFTSAGERHTEKFDNWSDALGLVIHLQMSGTDVDKDSVASWSEEMMAR